MTGKARCVAVILLPCLSGLSLKTQLLFLIVFSTRYLDIFFNWRILYNVVMKVRDFSASHTNRAALALTLACARAH